MILYLGAKGNHNIFFLGKSDGGLDIYGNFTKIVIEALAMPNGLLVVSLLTVIAVGKIWLQLFEDFIFFIRFHIFFRYLMFS